MPFVHGKNSTVKVDNAAGALTDISAVCNTIDLPRSLDTSDVTTFGKNAKEYIAGLNDGTVSLSGLYDPAVDATLSAAFDAVASGAQLSATVEYAPAGGPVGATKPIFRQEVIWTSYSTTGSVSDPTGFKMEGQRTGAVTRVTA